MRPWKLTLSVSPNKNVPIKKGRAFTIVAYRDCFMLCAQIIPCVGGNLDAIHVRINSYMHEPLKSEDPAAGRAVTRFAAGSVFERHCLA